MVVHLRDKQEIANVIVLQVTLVIIVRMLYNVLLLLMVLLARMGEQ